MSTFVLLVLTTGARAQSDARTDARIGLLLGGGFGGESTLHADDAEVSTDLNSSFALGLRFTAPMHDYVTLAAEFRMLRWGQALPIVEDPRHTMLDISAMPAARYVFNVSPVQLEPYLGVPLGLSINILDDDPVGDLGKGSVGFHLGVLGGLAVHLSSIGLGFFFEVGWLHHQTFDKDGDADVRYRQVLNQAALHGGVSYLF